MRWNRGAKGAALLLVAGGIAWLYEAAMTETALLTEQVLQVCKKAPHIGAQRIPEYVRDPPPPSEIEVLRRGAIRVVQKDIYLSAYTTRDQYDDWTSVSQPDYGGVRGIYEDRTGGLIAIGDQISYRVTVELAEGHARFGRPEKFPTLFGRPCDPVAQFFGACQPAEATFSHELRAGLIGGFDRWGRERLFAVGLREGERETRLEAPQGGPLWYWNDVPGSGGALFRTRDRIEHLLATLGGGLLFKPRNPLPFLFFDGVRMHLCPPFPVTAPIHGINAFRHVPMGRRVRPFPSPPRTVVLEPVWNR